MTNLDVSKLDREDLASESFPVSSNAEFRLYFDPQAHAGIQQHAHQDHTVEICGILVGHWRKDEHGPYAIVEDIIRCHSATSKFAEVTFTHESWAKINEEMDSQFEDKRIVGWYHSHPDFGIFLSDRDCFIHEHFFSGPGQVAFVVDPVRELEGVFAWKNSKPTPMRHYWVGEKVCTVLASKVSPHAKADRQIGNELHSRNRIHSEGYPDHPLLSPLATMLLCLLGAFLSGYLLSGWHRTWERQTIVDGVVSNYTDFKLVKLGLREELASIEKLLQAATKTLQNTPVTTEDISSEKNQDLKKMRSLIVGSLRDVQQRITTVSNRYGFSDEERLALLRMKTRMDAEVKRLREQQSAKISKSPTQKSAESTVKKSIPESPSDLVTDPTSVAVEKDEKPSKSDESPTEK